MLFGALGFFLAVVMGVMLGLIGSGGSMLTVPIMVYIFQVKPFIATGYSLLVVGSTACLGAFSYWRQGLIRLKDTFLFILPSTVMITVTRRFILPNIPDPIVQVGPMVVSKGLFIMLIFALLMLFAGLMILKPVKVEKQSQAIEEPIRHPVKLLLGSALVGLLSGLVGAGGGFLIIPVLIALFNLSMREAVGTSLAVIAVNSLLGFHSDLLAGMTMDWQLLGPFLGLTLLGMLFGIHFNQKINNEKLKRLFGYFMLCLASGYFYF